MQELGIPTANVDADALRQSLAEAVTGIYCGWASIGSSGQVRMTPAAAVVFTAVKSISLVLLSI